MPEQRDTYENRCCCCSLRAACIIIGIIEALVIPFQSVFFINIVPYPVVRVFYAGIVIGLIIAAPLIYGAIKRNRFFLWPFAVINVIGVIAVPLIYYGIEIRNTRDPLGIAAVWIYTSILITLTIVQTFLTYIVGRYICELGDSKNRDHKYGKVGTPAEWDDLYPSTV